MKTLPILLVLILLNSCISSPKEKTELPFTKGVYGNSATLLNAGYSFDSLGLNAFFVRSATLNQEFYDTARQQKCRIYVEFPTLNGKNYLKDHPEAWPINEKGEQAPAADWFLGICPTDPGFKTYRSNQLKDILKEYKVDGIFLDYLHWHAQFETSDPILPETCFCDRCTQIFGEYINTDIPGDAIPEKAQWILQKVDNQWRDWRNSILNGWVEDMGDILKTYQPNALLGVFYCAWYPSDHQAALYRTLGIDVAALANRADVLSPMLFHQMKDRPTEWVGEYIEWLDKLIKIKETEVPLVWPIVQAHNNPGVVSPAEFKEVMLEGSRPPASGIMMFSDQSLIQDSGKMDVLKELYLEILK